VRSASAVGENGDEGLGAWRALIEIRDLLPVSMVKQERYEEETDKGDQSILKFEGRRV
jgi:hypothetical protein